MGYETENSLFQILCSLSYISFRILENYKVLSYSVLSLVALTFKC